ncbi:MAG: response regulator [Flavobacteriales bacterium]|nr:response regulator [Flavobacteriales bacterium]
MKLRILYIEDEETNRLIVKAALRRDYDVETVGSIAQAKSVMGQGDVHLVISDLMLQKELGLDFIKELKSTHPDIPVILLSGYVDPVVIPELIEKGHVDYFIPKSYQMEELEAMVRVALN